MTIIILKKPPGKIFFGKKLNCNEKNTKYIYIYGKYKCILYLFDTFNRQIYRKKALKWPF